MAAMSELMIADDFALIREDLKEGLEGEGFSIKASVSSGAEAVRRYEKGMIVLMDIEMESSDSGIKATEAILGKDENALVIFLTSHDRDDVIMTAMATGAKDFVVKGSDIKDIAEHIRRVEMGEPQLTQRVQEILMGEYKRLRHSEKSLLFFIQHLSSLTTAERELISCFMQGLKVKEIAERRFVEPVTVKSQIRTLLSKTGCSRTKEIVSLIRELGLERLFP